MQKEELQKITVEKKEGSTVEIKGELPFGELEKHRKSAVDAISKNVTIDGFRKGHIPENVLIQKVGEMAILSEMAERALARAYPEVVAHHELDVIGHPKITLTKLAKDNPLGFTILVAVVPEITLPDYNKLAKTANAEKESKEVTDEEVDKQINDILRQKAAYERLQSKAKAKGETTEHVHGENCDHDHDHEHAHEEDEPIEDKVNAEGGEGPLGDIKDLPIPELTDEFVKTLGQPGQFATVADFKSKIKEHIAVEKERDVASRHRAKITDSIVAESKMEMPQILIDSEINQMFGQMEEDLNRAQLKFEDYLGHIKKTREDLIKEWTPSAEKRAKLQLVLNEIAKKEKIEADPSMVDEEVSRLLEKYKDADEKRVRVYISSVLQNEAVLKKLEETK